MEVFESDLFSRQESTRLVRQVLADVARRAAAVSHSICWLAWAAEFNRHSFGPDRLEAYDGEVYGLLSDVLAARVELASLS